jgi:hypothetical protein
MRLHLLDWRIVNGACRTAFEPRTPTDCESSTELRAERMLRSKSLMTPRSSALHKQGPAEQ